MQLLPVKADLSDFMSLQCRQQVAGRQVVSAMELDDLNFQCQ